MFAFTNEEQINLLKQRVKERSAQITLMEAAPELWSKDFLQANRLEQAFDKRLIGRLYALKNEKEFVFKWCLGDSSAAKTKQARGHYRRAVNADMESNLF